MLPDLNFIEPQMPPPLCHLRQKNVNQQCITCLVKSELLVEFHSHFVQPHTKMLSQDPLQNTQMSVLKLNFLSILIMFRESPY